MGCSGGKIIMVSTGDWVKYTTERIEDPFGDGEEPKDVYAVVTSIIGDSLCTITWCEYEPNDDYPLFRCVVVPVSKVSVVYHPLVV